MANIKSAKKRARQNIVRRARNKSTLRSVRTAEKKLLKTLPSPGGHSQKESSQSSDTSSHPITEIKKLLRIYTSKISKATQKGMIKNKTASRKISRLSQRLHNVFRHTHP